MWHIDTVLLYLLPNLLYGPRGRPGRVRPHACLRIYCVNVHMPAELQLTSTEGKKRFYQLVLVGPKQIVSNIIS
jgi:hypothetical protein